MFQRKPQPALLGMAADMQLARQELFNEAQFVQLQKQIDSARKSAAYTMEGEAVTIDLRARWKSVPLEPTAISRPATVQRARRTHMTPCPHCAKCFLHLNRHLPACRVR